MKSAKICFVKKLCFMVPISIFYSCSTSIQNSKIDLKQLTPFPMNDRYITAVFPISLKAIRNNLET